MVANRMKITLYLIRSRVMNNASIIGRISKGFPRIVHKTEHIDKN